MDDDALMRAVRRPAQMYGAEFDEGLAERLIASVRGREDELPLLQHGLMLMWEEARRARSGERVALDGAIVDKAGGLAELLSEPRRRGDGLGRRARRAARAIVEAVFRALTDVNTEGSAIRRPWRSASSARSPARRRTSFARSSTPSARPASRLSRPYAPAPIDDKTVDRRQPRGADPLLAEDQREGRLAPERSPGWRCLADAAFSGRDVRERRAELPFACDD